MSNSTLQLGHFKLELKRTEFNSDREQISFAKKCVRIIRQTPEYGEWTKYIKYMLGYKSCVLTSETSDEVSIDIHHHPLTLFDIVNVILNTFLSNRKAFSSLDIMADALFLHFNNNIGYVPLVASLHEKYHNGFLIIPPKFINGSWDHLLKTPGYIVYDDVKMKAEELMDKKNNIHDTYINWKNVSMNSNVSSGSI